MLVPRIADPLRKVTDPVGLAAPGMLSAVAVSVIGVNATAFDAELVTFSWVVAPLTRTAADPVDGPFAVSPPYFAFNA